jgi:hypothetical protein
MSKSAPSRPKPDDARERGEHLANAPGAEGMPCRSANRAAWKYALLAAAFLAWLAFLIWVAVS